MLFRLFFSSLCPPSFLSRSIRSIHHSQKVLSMIIVALRFRSACNSCPVLVLSLSRTGITIWKGLLCFCFSALPWVCLSTLFFLSFSSLSLSIYAIYSFTVHLSDLRHSFTASPCTKCPFPICPLLFLCFLFACSASCVFYPSLTCFSLFLLKKNRDMLCPPPCGTPQALADMEGTPRPKLEQTSIPRRPSNRLRLRSIVYATGDGATFEELKSAPLTTRAAQDLFSLASDFRS